MTKKPSDDLEAVRTLVETLQDFGAEDQERIIRWTREKIGLLPSTSQETVNTLGGAENLGPRLEVPVAPVKVGRPDIKSFVNEKSPGSDNQFAAVVAYYYQFEAAEDEKKESINSEDLQEACRKVNRPRLASPAKTLNNAHSGGLLDKTGERGAFRINSVGENLVAMTLPGGATSTNTARRLRKRERKQGKSQTAKTKSSKPKSQA